MGSSKSCEGSSMNHCTRSSFKVTRLRTFEGSEMLHSVPCWVSVPGGCSANSYIYIQISIVSSQPSTVQGTREHCSDRATGMFAAVMREAATGRRQKIQLSSSVEKGQMMGAGQIEPAEGEDKLPPASQAHCSMFKERTGCLQSLQSLNGQQKEAALTGHCRPC